MTGGPTRPPSAQDGADEKKETKQKTTFKSENSLLSDYELDGNFILLLFFFLFSVF